MISPSRRTPFAAYVGYVRDAGNGYVSVEVPLGDRIEISVRA